MKQRIVDRKSWWTYGIFSRLGRFVLNKHFEKFEIINASAIPKDRPFILVSNHISRWDGLVVYRLIDRPANFMVHPNELRGLQGVILRSMGAFPASARHDLHTHISDQLRKGEGVVIFPEGDIYRDGTTHPFKTGAARFALNAAKSGKNIDIVPVAIRYSEDGRRVQVMVAEAIAANEYLTDSEENSSTQAVRALTDRLHREICHLRVSLGSQQETQSLYTPSSRKNWAPELFRAGTPVVAGAADTTTGMTGTNLMTAGYAAHCSEAHLGHGATANPPMPPQAA